MAIFQSVQGDIISAERHEDLTADDSIPNNEQANSNDIIIDHNATIPEKLLSAKYEVYKPNIFQLKKCHCSQIDFQIFTSEITKILYYQFFHY